ncbi:MAG: VWA domain-containing protein [Phycisphaeraceae bacterium]|nr:VWA domain-containing protein [Phycisphaerales bacterium]QOJ17896.1 MAG: VWA domain-containing protein [Phycisphaeraceae bacterium]
MNRPGPRHSVPPGGIVHTYQKYDPVSFPPPSHPGGPDVVSPLMEQMLWYGSRRPLTDEDLARAVPIDPSQIAGLGPSIDGLIELLRQRKAKILATYETETVLRRAARCYRELGLRMKPPEKLARRFRSAFLEEQPRDLERLWYAMDDEQSRFARDLVHLNERLGEKMQVDELASKYEFTGRTALTIEEAVAIKEELETIDKLLQQLEEAKKNARIGLIDMEALSNYAEPGDLAGLNELRERIAEYLRQMAEMQGLERGAQGYTLTPKAYRTFQGRLLERLFSDLQAARSGRHVGPVAGEGAVEIPRTKPYEFGDSVANMDIPQTLINAMIRRGAGRGNVPADRFALRSDDIEVHLTRNSPRCATSVLLDMSGSMRHDGQYINAKRMALALDGLIRREYPGDFLQFIEMYTFARPVHVSQVIDLLPRPVTVRNSVVRLRVDMSRDDVLEMQIPPHFTNIQRALQLARQFLSAQDTPNRQVVLITDGLPTAHFEGEMLYLLYPPDPRTEEATLREGLLCAREGITINIFLLPNWWQSEEDVQFAHRLAEQTGGRVFFTAGRDLDRFVVWDYVSMKRSIIG